MFVRGQVEIKAKREAVLSKLFRHRFRAGSPVLYVTDIGERAEEPVDTSAVNDDHSFLLLLPVQRDGELVTFEVDEPVFNEGFAKFFFEEVQASRVALKTSAISLTSFAVSLLMQHS